MMYRPLPLALLAASAFGQSPVEWPVYGGNSESTRYSPLKQIDRTNVALLQIAWTFDTGARGALQTSPIVVNGTLYGNTPDGHVIALNAATGKPVWTFDSKSTGQRVRGMTFFSDARDSRIFAAFGRYIYALDAKTGEPIP